MDEDVLTLALDRDALAVALLPDARREHPAGPRPTPNAGPTLPVPHFRSKEDVVQQAQATVVVARAPKGAGLPLGVWLFAAMIAGIVSFHFAPRARESVEQALRTLDGH
jgi:hypothetical protein